MKSNIFKTNYNNPTFNVTNTVSKSTAKLERQIDKSLENNSVLHTSKKHLSFEVYEESPCSKVLKNKESMINKDEEEDIEYASRLPPPSPGSYIYNIYVHLYVI